MVQGVSTGVSGLDQVVDLLRLGDNVVWQVDTIDHYRRYVAAYYRQAVTDKRTIVYFRFADHAALLDESEQPTAYELVRLNPRSGFEAFTSEVYQVIQNKGLRVFYVFDCLSDLLTEWSSDLMIGNFFRITCPFLYELDTIAYFALLRGAHAYDTIARIRETTQLLLDLYHISGSDYVHPLKVWQRYSPTMFLPHRISEDRCYPIDNSAEAARLFSGSFLNYNQASRQLDFWDRLFSEAEQAADPEAYFDRLCLLLLGSEGRITSLARTYFSTADLLAIKKREIGTGKIGGKSVGMLLARKIIEAAAEEEQQVPCLFEAHDSFFLGSDLFYTYIVQNGWWKLRTQQKTTEGYFKYASQLQENLRQGQFPPFIREQFQQMLEYFGQSPIIVRSSSLLEDNFGHAFAGKYESVFCANQGSPEERYAAFEQAVRDVYASMMDPSALSYRLARGLSDQDEQMALLVQRVSGSYHGHYFYPLMAGVGHSYNLYAWHEAIEPEAGLIRLVFGLGTRAVDRVESDYPRLVALNQPRLTPFEQPEDQRRFSQQYVDLLNLEQNRMQTRNINELAQEGHQDMLRLVGEVDWQETRRLAELGLNKGNRWLINFNQFLESDDQVAALRWILKTLAEAYQYPVDMEFTINQDASGRCMICLLQCRPLQTRRLGVPVTIPENIDINNIVLAINGHFMGGNADLNINYIIYVKPEMYVCLKEQERYQIARLIGRLNQILGQEENRTIMLLGPGRWGTSTPSLGVPVQFSEINRMAVLGELACETAGMIPELSYGSHFFQDLVETGIFYLAVMPQETETLFREDWLLSQSNQLGRLLPGQAEFSEIVQVIEIQQPQLRLLADIQARQLICALQ